MDVAGFCREFLKALVSKEVGGPSNREPRLVHSRNTPLSGDSDSMDRTAAGFAIAVSIAFAYSIRGT